MIDLNHESQKEIMEALHGNDLKANESCIELLVPTVAEVVVVIVGSASSS